VPTPWALVMAASWWPASAPGAEGAEPRQVDLAAGGHPRSVGGLGLGSVARAPIRHPQIDDETLVSLALGLVDLYFLLYILCARRVRDTYAEFPPPQPPASNPGAAPSRFRNRGPCATFRRAAFGRKCMPRPVEQSHLQPRVALDATFVNARRERAAIPPTRHGACS